jgi:hypothetical protein
MLLLPLPAPWLLRSLRLVRRSGRRLSLLLAIALLIGSRALVVNIARRAARPSLVRSCRTPLASCAMTIRCPAVLGLLVPVGVFSVGSFCFADFFVFLQLLRARIVSSGHLADSRRLLPSFHPCRLLLRLVVRRRTITSSPRLFLILGLFRLFRLVELHTRLFVRSWTGAPNLLIPRWIMTLRLPIATSLNHASRPLKNVVAPLGRTISSFLALLPSLKASLRG